MREVAEFRVNERHASLLFRPDEGKRLGSIIRRIRIDTNDPRYNEIGNLQAELLSRNSGAFFYGWEIRRYYDEEELDKASLFRLMIDSCFEPAGEECGTLYDDSQVCPDCGVGGYQASDLRLDMRKVPARKDIARTIADEWIVSQRFAECMADEEITGVNLTPVRHLARYEDDPVNLLEVPSGREMIKKAEEAGSPYPTWKFFVWINKKENAEILSQTRFESIHRKIRGEQYDKDRNKAWYQLKVDHVDVEVSEPTRGGSTPFDKSRSGTSCSSGNYIGISALTELTVDFSSLTSSDIACTRQFVGVRRGLLRPSRMILISQRLRKMIQKKDLKSCHVEIAHVA